MNQSVNEKVNRGVNFDWLRGQVDNKKSLEFINIMEGWHKNLAENTSMAIRTIQVAGLDISFRECEAAHSSKVFVEIFNEHLHFLHPEFESKENKTIIDLGANVGFYSLMAKKLMPDARIIAAEPNPAAFELLSKHVKDNNLQDVECVRLAIGESDEPIDFKFIPQASALGGKYLGELEKSNLDWVKKDMIQTISVDCVILGDLLEKYEVDEVDILKLDVQDMELEIFKSSINLFPKIRKIIVEPHAHDTKSELIEILTNNGFELVLEEPREFGDLYFINRSV